MFHRIYHSGRQAGRPSRVLSVVRYLPAVPGRFLADGDQAFDLFFLFINPYQFIVGKAGKDFTLEFSVQKDFPVFNRALLVSIVPVSPGQTKHHGFIVRVKLVNFLQAGNGFDQLSMFDQFIAWSIFSIVFSWIMGEEKSGDVNLTLKISATAGTAATAFSGREAGC